MNYNPQQGPGPGYQRGPAGHGPGPQQPPGVNGQPGPPPGPAGPYQQPPGHQQPGAYGQPGPYQQPQGQYQADPYQQSPGQYQQQGDGRRGEGARNLANTIHVVTGVIAAIFVLHIVFTVFGANESSGIVGFVYGAAQVFVLGFGDIFTPGDATLGVVLNYGLAAIVYLAIGRLIVRTLRSR